MTRSSPIMALAYGLWVVGCVMLAFVTFYVWNEGDLRYVLGVNNLLIALPAGPVAFLGWILLHALKPRPVWPAYMGLAAALAITAHLVNGATFLYLSQAYEPGRLLAGVFGFSLLMASSHGMITISAQLVATALFVGWIYWREKVDVTRRRRYGA